jgi:hypothetical protein
MKFRRPRPCTQSTVRSSGFRRSAGITAATKFHRVQSKVAGVIGQRAGVNRKDSAERIAATVWQYGSHQPMRDVAVAPSGISRWPALARSPSAAYGTI